MTDLERQWDDLPVGDAPVDAILREARRAARGKRRPEARLKRSLITVTALGGIAAAFVAGSLVTQDAADPLDDSSPGQAAPGGAGALEGGITPAAFQGELQAPASCDELLQHYVDQGLDRVGTYGWSGPYGPYDRGTVLAEATEQRLDAPDVAAAQQYSTVTKAARDSLTGTNVQEEGVDEPDTVKTDGTLVVRLRNAELTTYDASGDEVVELGSLDLGDFHDGEILLAGDTVVAVGNDGTRPRADDLNYDFYYGGQQTSPQTRVLTVDIADPAAPELTRTVDYDAELVATRQHGTDVRVVVKKGLPDLDFERDGRALQANRDLVEATTIDDWLPHVSVDGGQPAPLLECDRVAIPRAELGLATMAVVGFGATSPDDVETLGLAGDAPLSYESADHLYLASSGTGNDVCFECDFARTAGSGFDGTTHVYDFALDGTGASYVGAGEVEGTVRDRWSMDEVDGVLRLAVGPSSETGNFNSIVTMRAQTGDQGDGLVEIGRLDGLGVGENIEAVRWFGGLALLVTFRQIDPLYAVDLTDQADPTLIGELKIPGFSEYLHPLGPDRVVGIGQGPQPGGSGAQAGLFLVRDLTDLRRVDVESYGRGTYAKAGADPRQFTWLPEQRIALTVIQRGRSVSVSTLAIEGGQMENRMTQVEFGADADDVRLVPLLDGKVALVTGEDVEMFPLT